MFFKMLLGVSVFVGIIMILAVCYVKNCDFTMSFDDNDLLL